MDKIERVALKILEALKKPEQQTFVWDEVIEAVTIDGLAINMLDVAKAAIEAMEKLENKDCGCKQDWNNPSKPIITICSLHMDNLLTKEYKVVSHKDE